MNNSPDECNIRKFVEDINSMNSEFNYNFCNSVTEILRKWFICGFYGLSDCEIAGFYTYLWRFHKKRICVKQDDEFWKLFLEETQRINREKYSFKFFNMYISAIAEDLEISYGNFTEERDSC